MITLGLILYALSLLALAIERTTPRQWAYYVSQASRMLLKILSDFLTCARPKLRDVPSVRRFTGGPGQCSLRSCAWAQILRPSARSQQSANDPKRLQMDTEMYEAEKCSALILADTHRFTAAKF